MVVRLNGSPPRSADTVLSASARNREFIVRVFSQYGALFLLFMHIPFGLAIGRVHLFDTLLPSAATTSLHFLIPWILPRFGTIAAVVWLLSVSMFQNLFLSFWVGGAAGIQYYLFAISAVAIYMFHGYPRRWTLIFAPLPVVLFVAIELAVKTKGMVIDIDPAVAPWLAAANGAAAFSILIVLGLIFSRVTADAEEQLADEKDRSERLLLNILPRSIADRLKAGRETVIADRIDEVSVMFADLVGFTPYAREREPTAVVGMLNRLFRRFDARVDALGLEKIKTVGDAYMVVAGAPDRRADHLQALARLALDLVEEMKAFSDAEGHRFAIRVGIHVGPVVTGVIGTRKMAYDVWGDTVNIASRLESSSQPNRIHVTKDVVERLKDTFTFELRGPIDIKGVGEISTSFLTGATGA